MDIKRQSPKRNSKRSQSPKRKSSPLRNTKMTTKRSQSPKRTTTIRETLDLSFSKLKSVPFEITSYTQVTKVDLSNNFLTTFPEPLYEMYALQDIILDFNEITGFDMRISNLKQLRFLSITHNQLFYMNWSVMNEPVPKLTSLHLSHNKLSSLTEYFIFMFPALVYLFLDHNALYDLPEYIGKMKHLEVIDVSYNNLSSLPNSLLKLNLKQLIIDGNKINEPKSITIANQINHVQSSGSTQSHSDNNQISNKKRGTINTQRNMLSPDEIAYSNTITLRSGKRKAGSPIKRSVRRKLNFDMKQVSSFDAEQCGESDMITDGNALTYQAKDSYNNAITIYVYTRKNKKYAELANFCISNTEEEAKEGEFDLLLNNIVTEFKASHILWTFIDPTSHYWFLLLNTLVQAGFSNPYITDKSSQLIPIHKTVIAFYYIEDSPLKPHDILNTATKLRKQLLNHSSIKPNTSFNTEQINAVNITSNIEPVLTQTARYVISNHALHQFGEMMFEPVEYSGNLWINELAHEQLSKEETPQYTLEIDQNSIVKGSAENFSVNLTNFTTKIYFHTHPFICYDKIGCTIAWPSSPDMAFTMSCALFNYGFMHLVVTKEGIYVVAVPYWLYKLSGKMSEPCKLFISNITADYFFQDGEAGEFLRMGDKSEEEMIKQYFKGVKNFTLNTVLQYKNVKNTLYRNKPEEYACLRKKEFIPYLHMPLFDVHFEPWDFNKDEFSFDFP